MEIVNRDNLGLAAEFAVASELGRRNIYAQPTFGHRKRTDLLILSEEGKLLRIEVKGKQGDSLMCREKCSILTLIYFTDLRGNKIWIMKPL